AELTPALAGVPGPDVPQHIDLITTRYAGGPPIEQVNRFLTVHRVDMPPLDPQDLYNNVVANNQYFVDYARRLARQNRYDIIHMHDWLSGNAGITLKYEWRQPLVTTVHATERGRHQGHIPSATSHQIDGLEWQICHESWKTIVCSQFMAQELHHMFGSPYNKTVVIPNGIDARALERGSPHEHAALRREFAPNNERLLFYVGRIVHEKGLHVLLRAMPHILNEHPNTRLIVAGKNGAKMRPLATDLRIEPAVKFLDFISDRKRDHIYQIVDAAIFPSLYEPFGIVALEAMALGCNVLASDVGGLREVVHHMQNGLTFYPNDSESIAWAVRELFRDPQAARQRRERASAEVRHTYDWRVIAEDTTHLYADIIAERNRIPW
ncbi:MAG: glycosyltransferase family 4 protein, partial [Litorilinea sp.]